MLWAARAGLCLRASRCSQALALPGARGKELRRGWVEGRFSPPTQHQIWGPPTGGGIRRRQRNVTNLRNSLPQGVMAPGLDAFKMRLDRFVPSMPIAG